MAARLLEKIINSFFLRNLVVYTVVLFIIMYQQVARGFTEPNNLAEVFVNHLLMLLSFTFHNAFLYNRLFRQKKYVQYVLYFISELVVFHVLMETELRIFKVPGQERSLIIWLGMLFYDLAYIALALGVYLAFMHYKQEHDVLNLQYLKRDLELKQLKEQLSPHFLFNALNNIYSYTIECDNRSDELIQKLGDLMKMVLVNTEKDTIAIREEIDFMESYIAFEAERLGARCDISFRKEISDEHTAISPFLFFTFLDNAFKHGTRSRNRTAVNIYLNEDAGKVQFHISNNIISKAKASTGLGLANIRRRLELLYPGRHALEISETNGMYAVSLAVKL